MHDENIVYEQEGYAIIGFINSNGDCIDLEDRVYRKDELLGLLKIELEYFADRNIVH